MIKNVMSIRQGWLSLFTIAIVASFGVSQTAAAPVVTPNAAIKFDKVEKSKVKARKKTAGRQKSGLRKMAKSKKALVRKKIRKIRKSRGKKRNIVASKRIARASVRRKALRKVARKATKRKTLRRIARLSSKRKSLKRGYKKRRLTRRSKRRAISRRHHRGSLMATLKSVKPKGLPLRLAAAVVTVESGWRVNARGASGERGLMQLMPATARMMGARGNLYNPRVNMRAGTKYLHWCYRRARGNVAATIGCYNRGPGLMWSWKKNRITRRYVGKVHRYMRRS